MKVRFLEHAAEDIDAISAYASRYSRAAGARIDDELWTWIYSLEMFPDQGRTGRIPGTRELLVGPYVVMYAVDRTRDEVMILAVQHGAQRR